MRFITVLLKGIDRISEWSGKAAAWLIVASMMLTLVDVFRRYIMGRAMMTAYEIGYMFFGSLFMLGAAYTWSLRAHVRIDLFYSRLPPRGQAALDAAQTLLLFFPTWLLLFYYGIDFARESWGWREVTPETRLLPMYPFKTVFPIAVGLLLLQGVAELLRSLMALKRSQRP